MQAASEATGSTVAPYSCFVAAWRGDESEASPLISAALREVSQRGEGIGLAGGEWANALLNNGLGRYPEALTAAERARSYDCLGFSNWALAEVVEAAARSGLPDKATDAHVALLDISAASGTNWALGLAARSRALLAEAEQAEELYRESIERLARTRVRTELARSHLLYGEWLRRERRRGDARDQLRIAHDMFEAIGMEAFADRARRELHASGETARHRTVDTFGELTAQEAQVARLAREGLSNPEIGTRLFISVRTVEYHLSKVFSKLDITSRSQLSEVLT
jgi:DNA-binding CsgD family transcriptional regulator